MDAPTFATGAIERIGDLVHSTAKGLDPTQLSTQPSPSANSIGWLLWHITRIQDDHVADLMDDEQLWISQGHAAALGFDPDPHNSGYGHSPAEAAAVRIADPGALLAYHDAVAHRSAGYLATLDDDDLDRVVDDSYTPPVTAGVRWMSIISDSLQHLGQAAYARGQLGW
jgi:hypothetical protein